MEKEQTKSIQRRRIVENKHKSKGWNVVLSNKKPQMDSVRRRCKKKSLGLQTMMEGLWVKWSNGSDHIKASIEGPGWGDGRKGGKVEKNLDHFSICACHPCAGAMLIFSVSFQFYRMSPKRQTLCVCPWYINAEFSLCVVDVGRVCWERRRFALVWASSPRLRHHNSFGLNLELACLSLVFPTRRWDCCSLCVSSLLSHFLFLPSLLFIFIMEFFLF